MRAGVDRIETSRDNCMDCGHTRAEHDAEAHSCYGGGYCECSEFMDEEDYQALRDEHERLAGTGCGSWCGYCGRCE